MSTVLHTSPLGAVFPKLVLHAKFLYFCIHFRSQTCHVYTYGVESEPVQGHQSCVHDIVTKSTVHPCVCKLTT